MFFFVKQVYKLAFLLAVLLVNITIAASNVTIIPKVTIIPNVTIPNITIISNVTIKPITTLASTKTTNTSNCFYGISTTNTNEFVQVCLSSLATGVSFSKTSSQFVNATDLDQIWMLITAAMVFLMLSGFSFFEVGMVQKKNIQSVLFKNLLIACVTAIGYYLFGFCMSYGKLHSSNTFLGVGDTVILSHNYARWFYEWTFSAVAAIITSCALVERTKPIAYFVITLCLVWWIYPIIVHWLWSESGWLSPYYISSFGAHSHVSGGAVDFAGSCVVHIVGGWTGFAGAILLRPRLYRFDNNNKNLRQVNFFKFGRDIFQQVLGCLIIWFGFYGFTCGRTLGAFKVMNIASKVAVNTTLSASMACMITVVLDRIIQKAWRVSALCSGLLVGLVSISASCAVVDPWMAIIIGFVGGIFYIVAAFLEEKIHVDDPLNIWPTFGIGGFWGMIAVGFFGYHKNALLRAKSTESFSKLGYGMHWGRQLLAPVIVSAWAFGLGLIVFGILFLIRCLRVDQRTEEEGLDLAYYDEKNLGPSVVTYINNRQNA